MVSISYTSSPSSNSSGGSVKLLPYVSFSLYGRSRVAWKTLWIRQVVGSFNQYVIGPRTSVIVKGPSRFGFIFL